LACGLDLGKVIGAGTATVGQMWPKKEFATLRSGTPSAGDFSIKMLAGFDRWAVRSTWSWAVNRPEIQLAMGRDLAAHFGSEPSCGRCCDPAGA